MSFEAEGTIANMNACSICGSTENLLRCGQCKSIFYCNKEHQRQDWRKHKLSCKKIATCDNVEKKYGHIIDNQSCSAIPKEGSSEDEILNSLGVHLSPTNNNYQKHQSLTEEKFKSGVSEMPISGENITLQKQDSIKFFSEISLQSPSHFQDDYLEEMCRNVIQDLTDYGLCVLDNFLGAQLGKKVLREVFQIEKQGLFRDGQLVSTKGKNKEELKTIRSDQICWVHGSEPDYPNIGYLISQVDSVIMKANRMPKNGKLRQFNINGRTKVSQILKSTPCGIIFILETSLLNSYQNNVEILKKY